MPLQQPPCPGKTSVDGTHAGTWRGTVTFPTAGPGKGLVCAGVGVGGSRDHVKAAKNIPQGVTRGDVGESITGLSLGTTYLLLVPSDNPPCPPCPGDTEVALTTVSLCTDSSGATAAAGEGPWQWFAVVQAGFTPPREGAEMEKLLLCYTQEV